MKVSLEAEEARLRREPAADDARCALMVGLPAPLLSWAWCLPAGDAAGACATTRMSGWLLAVAAPSAGAAAAAAGAAVSGGASGLPAGGGWAHGASMTRGWARAEALSCAGRAPALNDLEAGGPVQAPAAPSHAGNGAWVTGGAQLNEMGRQELPRTCRSIVGCNRLVSRPHRACVVQASVCLCVRCLLLGLSAPSCPLKDPHISPVAATRGGAGIPLVPSGRKRSAAALNM